MSMCALVSSTKVLSDGTEPLQLQLRGATVLSLVTAPPRFRRKAYGRLM